MRKIALSLAVALVLLAAMPVMAAAPAVAVGSMITAVEQLTVTIGDSSRDFVVAYTSDSPPLYCVPNLDKGRTCADLLEAEGAFLSGSGGLYRDRSGTWVVVLSSYDLSPGENVDN